MGSLDLFLGISQIISGLYTMAGGFRKDNTRGSFFIDELDETKNQRNKLKSKVYNIHSLDERIKRLKEVINRAKINPRVRELAVKIVSKRCGDNHCIREKDYKEEAKTIFDWVRKYIRYVHDIRGIDTFQHPLRTIEFGGGDCDDFSILLASLYTVLGYPVKLKIIRTKGADDFNHIYVLVGIPPNKKEHLWIPADASVNKPFGWEAPKSMVAEYRLYDV